MIDETDAASTVRREKRKRNRLALSCVQCRRRKIGCDRKSPCSNCIQNSTRCEYRSDGDHLHGTGLIPGQSVMNINAWSNQAQANANPLVTPQNTTIAVNHEHVAVTDDMRFSSLDIAKVRPGLNGRFEKSRLRGESHWMSNTIEFPNLVIWKKLFYDENGNIHPLLTECKQLARNLKSKSLASTQGQPNLSTYLPGKEVCDALVQSYLETFECIFRIFHVPTFREEYAKYWADPRHASNIFLAKLLLVAAIGACFYKDEYNTEPPLHIQSSGWLYAVQAWLQVPLAKQYMNLSGVQIHCLLVLALQTTTVGGDLSWIAAGTLVRIAMTIGLHRDPVHFSGMSVLQAEMRRRLWATTLEIATQTSLDSGMPPLLSWKDFDCRWPLNINDEDIDEETIMAPTSKPTEIFTQNSIQCALTRSLLVRLKIAKLLNNLHSQFSHEDAVHIGTELTNVCRMNSKILNSLVVTPNVVVLGPTSFQLKMLDILSRRFLLSLHLPFAKKAWKNVAYYYSRKVSVDSALQLLSYSLHPSISVIKLADEDYYTRLRIYGRGMFRSILIQASAQIAMELVATLHENSVVPTASLNRNELYQALVEMTDIARRRVKAGETNVKMYVCLSCVLEQVRALDAGFEPAEQVLERSRKVNLEWCLEVLKERVAREDAESQEGLNRAEYSVTTVGDAAIDNLEPSSEYPALWDSNLAKADWGAWLPPQWENEGFFYDDEL